MAVTHDQFGVNFEHVFGAHKPPPKDDLVPSPMLSAIRGRLELARRGSVFPGPKK
jgi:hypothetical protein